MRQRHESPSCPRLVPWRSTRARARSHLQAEYDAIHAHVADATPQERADILIDLMVKLHPQARALTAFLDSRTDWTEVRRQFRTQTLAGIKTALTICAPDLDGKEA